LSYKFHDAQKLAQIQMCVLLFWQLNFSGEKNANF
jgi:hypothetical protein